MSLFTGTIELLRQGTVVAARRHELLAQNIANAETPGYRAQDLTFAGELSAAQQVRGVPIDPSVAPDMNVRLVESPDETLRSDGNTVDIDRQMPRLAENTVYQNTLIHILTARFRSLRSAINGQA